MKQRVLFVYNWVPDHLRKGEFSECASTATIERIQDALQSFDLDVIALNVHSPEQMTRFILEHLPLDIAFVIAEGFLDEPSSLFDGSGALRVRQVLQQLSIPFTHSGTETMERCRNKDLTYHYLSHQGVNIPRYFVFEEGKDETWQLEQAEQVVGYPMFVKPGGGGNSIGIDEFSIVRDRDDLKNKLLQLRSLIGNQPVICETYLSGREYTAGIVGNFGSIENGVPHVLPVIAFPEILQVRSQQVKKMEYQLRDQFELLSEADPVALKIQEMSHQVFQTLGAHDILRLDLKQDEEGRLYVIDVNGTPSLAVHGSLAFMTESLGISHSEMIGFILYIAMTRYHMPVNEPLSACAVLVLAKIQGSFDNQVA